MLKQIPFKKEYLLVAGTILLLLISYQLAFKKTIEAWQINKQLNSQIAQATDVSYQPAYLQRKNYNLSKLIEQYKVDTINFRSNVINTISAIAEKMNVKLKEVPLSDPLLHTDKFIIQKLNFEGDFFALTRVLNQLQETNGIGVVRSVIWRNAARSLSKEDKIIILNIYLEIAK